MEWTLEGLGNVSFRDVAVQKCLVAMNLKTVEDRMLCRSDLEHALYFILGLGLKLSPLFVLFTSCANMEF